MPSDETPDAIVFSGDGRIREMLSQEGAVVMPANAFNLDGFVNDTFTEYTNASVYRPGSVCRARLVSTLRDMYQLDRRGGYYFGFTMYTTAGYEEPVEMWIGHRQVARAYLPDPDNRVHLFVAPEKITFRGGELKRLVTSETDGPCRIENLVLLPKRPRPPRPGLKVISPHVDLRYADGGLRAYVTWITNRPASGKLRWGAGKRLSDSAPVSGPLANHEVVLDGLDAGKTVRYEIEMADRTGDLKAVHAGSFKTDLSPPESRTRKARMPLLLRRPVPGSAPWPASVGVPFPKGALGNPDEVRLLGEDGAEIPLQAQAQARWEDGSVRWALLDFQGGSAGDCTVEYGRDVSRTQPGDALSASESGTRIAVTTGRIRVEFPKDRVVLPGVVSLRGEDGDYRKVTPAKPSAAVTLVADDGAVYESGRPDAVVLEESGPERACVRIDLSHRKRGGRALFRSTFRVHLFRNSGAVRVLHTFENDRTEETFTDIRSLSLRADLDVGAEPSGRIGRRKADGLASGTVSLRQTHDNRYAIQQGGGKPAAGRRADGTADLAGSAGGAFLSVKDFWQNYPKGIELDAQGMTFQVCPPLDADAYPRGGELEDRLYYYLLDGRYKFKYGVSRTHEFWLHFRPGGAPPAGFGASVQSPPLYSASLEDINRSRVATQLPSKEKSPFPPYEAWIDAAQKAYAEDRKGFRAYGMLNYGDWFGERVYNWGNMEYDTPWCFLQEYLRGGHPDFYTWAEEAAHHLVDVDTCHYSADAGEVGGQYVHCVGHVGSYYPDGYRERAIFGGRWSVSHTWVEGPFLYHLLSGDRRAQESAMKTSALLVGEMLNDYDFTNCRNCGWHLIHLAAAYRATGRRIYLNAARIIVDRVLERQRPSGGWDRLMVPGHCFCIPPRHTGNAAFMVGVLMAGLKYYYESTGEKRVADAIVAAADYVIDSTWEPEREAFRYTSCPHSSGSGAPTAVLKGIATAYGFSRKKRFREVLLAGAQKALGDRRPGTGRGSGKSISMPMRSAPQVLVDLPKGAG